MTGKGKEKNKFETDGGEFRKIKFFFCFIESQPWPKERMQKLVMVLVLYFVTKVLNWFNKGFR